SLPPGVKLTMDVQIPYNNVEATATNVALSSPTVETGIELPNTSLYVAPSDGDVAYICQTLPSHGVRFWRTRDAGQHWAQLPTIFDSSSLGCLLTIDQNNPLTIIARLLPARSLAYPPNYYALVAGATRWQQLGSAPYSYVPTGAPVSAGDSAYGYLDALVSVGNTYYAIWTTISPSGAYPIARLFVSTDQMRSWHEVNLSILTHSQEGQAGVTGIQNIWAQPNSGGALLAQTYTGALWITHDEGAHWQRIAFSWIPPVSQLTPSSGAQTVEGSSTTQVWVQQPIAGRPFRICVLVLNEEGGPNNGPPLYCSRDSGKTWKLRPQPITPDGIPTVFPTIMLPTGALLAWNLGTIYLLTGDSGSAQSGHAIGSIPTPSKPNNILVGQLGVTATGVTFWQPLDAQTVYVSQWRV
ncbi:MAG TPA: hypothetical protein VKQ36_17665, partial [Ktedonobacterales bacterium]|nr:hypothetical protein [Ktedonobacterales bacterium]